MATPLIDSLTKAHQEMRAYCEHGFFITASDVLMKTAKSSEDPQLLKILLVAAKPWRNEPQLADAYKFLGMIFEVASYRVEREQEEK